MWAAESVRVGGREFVNKGLVGVGRLPAALRDQYGETVGSGSGFAAMNMGPTFIASLPMAD